MWKANAKSRMNANGVVKIKRASYSTQNGFSVKNGWWVIRKAVWDRDKGLCVPCMRKKIITKGVEVHHLIPLSKGGTNTMANLMVVCLACHEQRHNHLFRSR